MKNITISAIGGKKVEAYRTIYNILVTKHYYFNTEEGLKRYKCPACNSLKVNSFSYNFLCIDCLKNKSLRSKYRKQKEK